MCLADHNIGVETINKAKAATKLLPFDAARYLSDDAVVAEYMPTVLEIADPDLLLLALADVARTRGLAQVAKDAGLATGLSREQNGSRKGNAIRWRPENTRLVPFKFAEAADARADSGV